MYFYNDFTSNKTAKTRKSTIHKKEHVVYLRITTRGKRFNGTIEQNIPSLNHRKYIYVLSLKVYK